MSAAGDVNGDGLDDFIIGAPRVNVGSEVDAGAAYVIFGNATGFPQTFDLETLDGDNGFRIDGVKRGDVSGASVSSAGDFNGDGFDDIIIGAKDGNERLSGESYIVFGKDGGFAANLDLASLDGADGFRIVRDPLDAAYDRMGEAVSSAGDVNGDGFDDIIIGAPGGNPGFQAKGLSYVIFGRADGFSSEFDLATLDGGNGFRIDGIDPYDNCGYSVSSAGDINGDGFDDILIGAYFASPGKSRQDAGESYVVFGKADGFEANIALAALDGNDGFRIAGIETDDKSGVSVSDAGDINGDGLDDILIGATGGLVSEPDGAECYVVFGTTDAFSPVLDLAMLDGKNGFRIAGSDGRSGFSGTQVSSAGDVNGDGFDDILFGTGGGYSGDEARAGNIFLIFGQAGGFSANFDLTRLDGTNGVRIEGVDAFDYAGRVSSAGDINGDGFDDIVISAIGAEPPGKVSSGESYIIFGQAPTEGVIRIGSEADQTIRGGDFNDLLRGRQGDDVLIGGEGDNWLRGGHGADALVGGSGVDRMNGGDGHDSVSGGAGADVFVLASVSVEDSDTLLDFAPGEDRIALGSDAFGLAEGALDPATFVIGDAPADADDRLIYDDASGELFFDADGSGAGAQVLIATLTGAPTLAASDIFVV